MIKLTREKATKILGYGAPVLFVGAMLWGFFAYSLSYPGMEDPLKMAEIQETNPSKAEGEAIEVEQGQTGGELGTAESTNLVGIKPAGQAGQNNNSGTIGLEPSAQVGQDVAVPALSDLSGFFPGWEAGINDASYEEALDEEDEMDYSVLYGGKEKRLAENDDSFGEGGEGFPGASQAGGAAAIVLRSPLSSVQVLRYQGLSYSSQYGDYRFQGGVDLEVLPGEEVFAAAPGQVGEISYSQENKFRVAVSHSFGGTTIYSGMDQVYVVPGEEISGAKALGKMAEGPKAADKEQNGGGVEADGAGAEAAGVVEGEMAIGEHSPTYLRWELKLRGKHLDPLKYIGE